MNNKSNKSTIYVQFNKYSNNRYIQNTNNKHNDNNGKNNNF